MAFPVAVTEKFSTRPKLTNTTGFVKLVDTAQSSTDDFSSETHKT